MAEQFNNAPAPSRKEFDDLAAHLVTSYESIENGTATIIRMGKLRILTMHGLTGMNTAFSLPAGDAPSTHVTSACYVTDSNYNSIRIGRAFVESGTLNVRQVYTYNNSSTSMAVLASTDRVYGEIVYCVS